MNMQFLIPYAMRFVGESYHWGGDDPILGFDCSGFVQELLMAAAVVKRGTPKMRAADLFEFLQKNGGAQGRWGAGSIAFFGPDAKGISHIGFCIDSWFMLHAASGDSTTINDTVAAAKNAFVRLDAIKYRKDFLCVVKPTYVDPT
jgi:cell wall-associated NlpC family hydrolase